MRKNGKQLLSLLLCLLLCLSLFPVGAFAADAVEAAPDEESAEIAADGTESGDAARAEEAEAAESAEEPAEELIEEPAEKPVEEPAEEPVELPAEELPAPASEEAAEPEADALPTVIEVESSPAEPSEAAEYTLEDGVALTFTKEEAADIVLRFTAPSDGKYKLIADGWISGDSMGGSIDVLDGNGNGLASAGFNGGYDFIQRMAAGDRLEIRFQSDPEHTGTSISFQVKRMRTDEGFFDNAEELREVLDSGFTGFAEYTGGQDLTASADFTIPAELQLGLQGYALVIPAGVTVTVAEGGTLQNGGVTGEGSLVNNGSVYLDSIGAGLQFVNNGDGSLNITISSLQEIDAYAALAKGLKIYAQLACEGPCTLTQNAVIPGNVWVGMNGGGDRAFLIASGVTLTVGGEFTPSCPVRIEGSLINNGKIENHSYECNTITLVPGGVYDGTGTLLIHTRKLDGTVLPLAEVLPGFDLTSFHASKNPSDDYTITKLQSLEISLDTEVTAELPGNYQEVVFRFTPAESGNYSFNVPSYLNLSLYDSEGNCLKSINDVHLRCSLTAGESYSFGVSSYSGMSCTVKLTRYTEPENTPIALDTTVSGHAEQGEPVWYSCDLPAEGDWVLFASSEDWFNSTVYDALETFLCSGSGENHRLAFHASGRILIQIQAYGDYTLRLTRLQVNSIGSFAELKALVAADDGSPKDVYYFGQEEFVFEESIVIPENMRFYSDNEFYTQTVRIPEGVTVTARGGFYSANTILDGTILTSGQPYDGFSQVSGSGLREDDGELYVYSEEGLRRACAGSYADTTPLYYAADNYGNGQFTLSGELTIPDNLNVDFRGNLTVNAGAALTVNGAVTAYQTVIDGSMTVHDSIYASGLGRLTVNGSLLVEGFVDAVEVTGREKISFGEGGQIAFNIQAWTLEAMDDAMARAAAETDSHYRYDIHASGGPDTVLVGSLSHDVTVAENVCLYLYTNSAVTVPEDITLTVNGSLYNLGSNLTVNGSLINNNWISIEYSPGHGYHGLITFAPHSLYDGTGSISIYDNSGSLTQDTLGLALPGLDMSRMRVMECEVNGSQLRARLVLETGTAVNTVQFTSFAELKRFLAEDYEDGQEYQLYYVGEDVLRFEESIELPAGITSFNGGEALIPAGVELKCHGSTLFAILELQGACTVMDGGSWYAMELSGDGLSYTIDKLGSYLQYSGSFFSMGGLRKMLAGDTLYPVESIHYGRDGGIFTVSEDLTIPADTPNIYVGGVIVPEGVTLTVNEGLYLLEGASEVNGVLVNEGRVICNDQLSFRSDRCYRGAGELLEQVVDDPFTRITGLNPENFSRRLMDPYYVYVRTASGGWVDEDGKRYYLDENGEPLKFWQQIDGEYYHFSAEGVMDTGWLKSGGKWYYLAPDTGVMAKGFVRVGAKTYCFDDNGAMLTFWQQIDGSWYHFQSGGAMDTGWLQSGGKWYYFGSDGVMLRYWQQIGSSWYHFQSSGAMDTGWLQSGGNWYYFKDSGAMVEGWQQIGSSWYYFRDGGAMATGWQKIGSTWYYFQSGGAMVTGWQKIGSTWYYFQSSGAMKTGWLKLSGNWYYFESSGAMVTGSRVINGKTYNFNSSGVCLNP